MMANKSQAKPWTKQFELEFWMAYEDGYYLDRVRAKYELFGVNDYFDKKVDLAVDVGGGKFGGALYFFKQAHRKVLIDILAKDYLRMNTIPDDVTTISSDFGDLLLEDDSVDALFAWSVLDHALTKKHFYKGQAELARVLRPNGLLFFEQLLSDTPKDGHTIVLSEDEVLSGFKRLVKLEVMSPDRFYAVFTKEKI